jgi:Xaa-Pro aminopeptidase
MYNRVTWNRGKRPATPIAVGLMLATIFGISPVLIAEGDDLAQQPKSEYKARRQKLMDQTKDGIVVLIGAREDEFGEVGRFRQKNDFMYLTGVETPSSYLMLIPAGLVPGKPAEEILFIPPRNLLQERWTGVQVGPGPESEQKFGIQQVLSTEKFYGRLLDLLTGQPPGRGRQLVRLYTLFAQGTTASLTRESQFIDLIRNAAPGVPIIDVGKPYLAEMRKIKGPSEAKLLQRAVDVTAQAFRDAPAAIKPGTYEYEVQAVIEAAFTRNGSERPGYPSIIGSGINSTILHYDQNHKKIESGDTVVCDVGAEYSYYTADITRTFPSSGKFTRRQREIYQLVLDAQRAAEKAFKPGQMTLAQLQQVAVGVMRSSPLRDKDGNTLERYFIHGLGHWLGMDVHDVGDYSKPIPPGAAITIEPGIYIPDEKFGVRIEDDYLVTETGLIKMSEKIPSEPDEIERLMTSEGGSGKSSASNRMR